MARELFGQADLVIPVDASLTYYTVDGGATSQGPKGYIEIPIQLFK
jgi:hypothetical protein